MRCSTKQRPPRPSWGRLGAWLANEPPSREGVNHGCWLLLPGTWVNRPYSSEPSVDSCRIHRRFIAGCSPSGRELYTPRDKQLPSEPPQGAATPYRPQVVG